MRYLLVLGLLVAFGLAPGATRGETPESTRGGAHESSEPAGGADLAPARALIRSGEFEAAEEALALLQIDFPDDLRILLVRGEVLLTLKRVNEAVPLLEACAEAAPEQPRVHFQLGAALWASGSLERALEQFALEIVINDDRRVQHLARQNRSLLYQQQRKWLEAAKELEQVLELDPSNAHVYGDMARIFMQAGRLADAQESLRRGREAGFRSARLQHSLGIRYFNIHAHENARSAFLEALEIDPDLAEAHRNLADALEQLGDADGAVQHLRSYLAKRPDSPHAEQIKARIRRAEGG